MRSGVACDSRNRVGVHFFSFLGDPYLDRCCWPRHHHPVRRTTRAFTKVTNRLAGSFSSCTPSTSYDEDNIDAFRTNATGEEHGTADVPENWALTVLANQLEIAEDGLLAGE